MKSKICYLRALELDPKDKNINDKILLLDKFIQIKKEALNLIKSDNFEKAVIKCEECFKLSSENPDCFIMKVKILIHSKKYKESLEILTTKYFFFLIKN